MDNAMLAESLSGGHRRSRSRTSRYVELQAWIYMNFILEFFSFILIYYRDPQEINFILLRPADRPHVP